jgi:hypothetical protein
MQGPDYAILIGDPPHSHRERVVPSAWIGTLRISTSFGGHVGAMRDAGIGEKIADCSSLGLSEHIYAAGPSGMGPRLRSQIPTRNCCACIGGNPTRISLADYPHFLEHLVVASRQHFLGLSGLIFLRAGCGKIRPLFRQRPYSYMNAKIRDLIIGSELNNNTTRCPTPDY